MENKEKKESKEARETGKKQILLRISPSLWRELSAWAEDDFRSINGQIEFLLTECVRKRKKRYRDTEDFEGEFPEEGTSD